MPPTYSTTIKCVDEPSDTLEFLGYGEGGGYAGYITVIESGTTGSAATVRLDRDSARTLALKLNEWIDSLPRPTEYHVALIGQDGQIGNWQVARRATPLEAAVTFARLAFQPPAGAIVRPKDSDGTFVFVEGDLND